MESKEAKPVRVDNKPFEYTMSLIGGKWKLNIPFWLWRSEVLRYGELKRNLGDIAHKMLSAKLKELEKTIWSFESNTPRSRRRSSIAFRLAGKPLCPSCTSCAFGAPSVLTTNTKEESTASPSQTSRLTLPAI